MAAGITNQNINTPGKKLPVNQTKVKEHIHELKTNEEKRDNVLTVGAGLSVLAGLGIAMLYREQVIRFCRKSYNKIKNRFQPKEPQFDKSIRPHGGPDINFDYGTKAIQKSWDKYIGKMEGRIANHDKFQAKYNKVFFDHERRLDELEAIAKKRVISRGDVWK